RYTVENAVFENGRRLRIDEKVVDRKTIDVKPPPLPGTPPNRKRKVFEVAGADARAVQKAVDEAGKLQRRRAVGHLPRGTYQIARTLTLPTGCDVQMIGDGASEVATVLEWVGKPREPLLRLGGPARATLEDFCVRAGSGTGILVTDCDQDGGKVFADQLNVTGNSPDAKPIVGVLVDGVERSDVQLRNCQGGAFMEHWLHVRGGLRGA